MTIPLPAVVVWHVDILRLIGAGIATSIILGIVVYEVVKGMRNRKR